MNPVLDVNSLCGDFSVLCFLLRRQFTAFGFLGRSRQFRVFLIGIRFVTQQGFVTQRCWQSLCELALFIQLDVGLWAAMPGCEVKHFALPIADDLRLKRVLSFCLSKRAFDDQ